MSSVHPVNDGGKSDDEMDDFLMPALPEAVKIEGYESLGVVLPAPGKKNHILCLALNFQNHSLSHTGERDNA